MFKANRFRECREKTLYSQKQVALMLGVKPPQISKWESGSGGPSRENCIKLAKLYDVSVDYLLGISNEPSVYIDSQDQSPSNPRISIVARGMEGMTEEEQNRFLAMAQAAFPDVFMK